MQHLAVGQTRGWNVIEPPQQSLLRAQGIRFSGFECDLDGREPVWALPSGVTIVLGLDGRVRVGKAGLADTTYDAYGTCLAPLSLNALSVEPDPRMRGLVVSLAPWVAGAVLESGRLGDADGVTDTFTIGGRGADAMVARLRRAADWDERFAALANLLRADCRPTWPPEVILAWRRLAHTGGTMPITQLATELGASIRSLQQRFRSHVGVPPKAVARVFRARRACRLLLGGRTTEDAALACGYFDLAHLTRDFKALLGATPRRYVAEHRGARGAFALTI